MSANSDDLFRPSPGKGRTESPPNITSFRKALSISRRSLGLMRPGNGGSKRLTNGRGVSKGKRYTLRDQRVIVKVRLVGRRGPIQHSKASLQQNLRYIARDGVGEDKQKAQHFNKEGDVSKEQVKGFVNRAENDRHHFRLIVSPEQGADLNLREYAQEFMQQVEVDLGTKLEWIGAAHYNTDKPHVHLLIRGKTERNKDLIINRDYIGRGFRENARDLATRHLGPRIDYWRERERQTPARQQTAFDIQRAAGLAVPARPYRTKEHDLGRGI